MNIVARAVRRAKILTGLSVNWSEHRKSFGNKNPDKVFYVIRRSDCLAGVNSHFITNMGHIRYALLKGYIPIVDMQNYPNALLEAEEIGKANAWERYFKQPCSYSLEEVYQSKNVILSEGTHMRVYPNDSMEFFTRPELVELWHSYWEKYLGFSKEMESAIEEKSKQYLGEDILAQRVCGVFLRGTDYVSIKPYEHPVQPSVQQAIKKAEYVADKYSCRWIFLVTEDLYILDSFRQAFGDNLIYIKDQERYGALEKGVHIAEYSFNRPMDRYLKGVECLTQMGLLMKCNCLIGGRTSGSVACMVMQPSYEYTFFWNLGRYGIDDILEKEV